MVDHFTQRDLGRGDDIVDRIGQRTDHHTVLDGHQLRDPRQVGATPGLLQDVEVDVPNPVPMVGKYLMKAGHPRTQDHRFVPAGQPGPWRAVSDEHLGQRFRGRLGTATPTRERSASLGDGVPVVVADMLNGLGDQIFKRGKVVGSRRQWQSGPIRNRTMPDRIKTTLQKQLPRGSDQQRPTARTFGSSCGVHPVMVAKAAR